MWHVLTLGAMVACVRLSVWQWDRAGSALGSTLNIGYGIQWPFFAVFFGVMWWRFLRMELRALREAERNGAPRSPDAAVAAVAVGPGGLAEPSAPAAPADNTELSPFRRSPLRAPVVTAAENPELAAYNRALAALSDRDARSR